MTRGTLFQDTHKPLRLWFQAIWYVVNQKNGVSALGLQKALGLGSYHTAWEWLHKLRRAMVRPGRDRLSGLVEMDETFIGGERIGKRGRGAEGKTLVLIAVEELEHGIGHIRLSPLANASGEAIKNATLEAMVRTRMPGGVGGAALRGVPLSRSSACCARSSRNHSAGWRAAITAAPASH